MEEQPVGLNSINYREAFPWLGLFRAFRIALNFRMLLLAGAALMVLSAGQLLFTTLPFAPENEELTFPQWPWEQSLRSSDSRTLADSENRSDLPKLVENDPMSVLASAALGWGRLLVAPFESVFEPAGELLKTRNSWPKAAYEWTRLLWAFMVWALFGGALTRMAAVQFARDERIGMRAALKFSAERFLSYFSAPLIPAAGFGFFWLLCFVGGLIGRINYVGDIIVGALWILPLLFALVMSLILVGIAVGWPLMLATISVEGSDAFDGFSRAYSYVYNRPWHYLWYAVVAMVYGSLVIFFVSLMTWLVVYLAGWGVSAGMGTHATSELLREAPELVGGANLLLNADGIPETGGFAAQLTGAWLHVVAVLLVGFVYSYFWTVSTIIYFLLRQGDDSTELDVVYLPEVEEQDDLLPLVGVAASDQPIIERPASDEISTSAKAEIYSGDTEMDIDAEDLPKEDEQETPKKDSDKEDS